MSPNRKNFLVGVTMMFGLIALGWMIIRFGGQLASPFADQRMAVRFVSDRAEGVTDGSAVLYKGVAVGRVLNVYRAENQEDVVIEAVVDRSPPLPKNVTGHIEQTSLLGASAAIKLILVGEKVDGQMQAGQEIRAEFRGAGLVPPAFEELAVELQRSGFIKHMDEAVMTIQQNVTKAGTLLDSLNSIVGDEKMREDLRSAIANVRAATDTANRIGKNLESTTGKIDKIADDASVTVSEARVTITTANKNLEDLSKQIASRIEQTAKLLQTLQSITTKVEQGGGTAGMLVNDPRLYESLVDTSRELNLAVTDLRRLVQQWEEEGFTAKLR